MIDDEPQIEVEPDLEGRAVVRVHGPLDLPEVGSLRAVLTELRESGCPVIVVDLEHVNFIGSSGLGALLQAQQDLDRLGRRLVLRGAASQIRRAFEITHLDEVFEFEDPIG